MTSVIERPPSADEDGRANGPPQATVERVVRPMPDRYRNPIGRYKVRRSADCRSCAVCVDICPYGVHVKPAGYKLPLRPRDYLCIGPKCAETDHYCVEHCPNKALSVGRNPTADAIGDPRWTSDLLLATWRQAETGSMASVGDLEYRHGASGGGFDALRFRFPETPAERSRRRTIDTRLDLNRRDDGRPRITIDLPIYGGGMSFGSVSIHVMLAQGAGGHRLEHLHLHRRGRLPRPAAALRRPRHHPGRDRPLRRARGDDPAGADRRVQVRAGRQARPGRPPARRQEHARRGADARGGGGQRPLLAVPVPQRLLGRGPQEAPRLDQGDQPAGAGLGQGLDADRRGHGGGRQLLRRRAHHPPRRQLRRHRRGAGHRQEEHRHAHRVRDPQGAPLPGRRGHPRRGRRSSPAAASARPTTC